ncbi:hypothetical protein Tco_0610879, partial [Tanacetum coccineum]
LYKPTNNNLRTSSNSKNKNETKDTTPRYNNDNQSGQFGNQRTMTVAGAKETVGSQVVQQNGIQCFNCKGFGHYAKEYRKPKWVKDYMYHKEKMMMNWKHVIVSWQRFRRSYQKNPVQLKSHWNRILTLLESLFNSCTGKVESEPTHGSNVDIPHIHACKQTLGLSAGTSFNGQKQQRIDLNADAQTMQRQEKSQSVVAENVDI